MKPEQRSRVLLATTRAKAKMYEYGLPEPEHINIPRDPARLLRFTVGALGDLAADMSSNPEVQDQARVTELTAALRFAARYFDAYVQTRLVPALDGYLVLLASASYYLCDLPGSSSVLASRLPAETLNLHAEGLELLVWWLLRADFSAPIAPTGGQYRSAITELSRRLVHFYASGDGRNVLLDAATALRLRAYDSGTDRELLLADTAAAILRRRCDTSAWYCLPRYSDLPIEAWRPAFQKPSFVRELWPAQRLLGERGVFRGASAIVQMPTSAGKSRATEIVIRSAFLADRASLAVVVVPFRALCHEIRESLARSFQGEPVTVNELSDVFQVDFEVDELLSGRAIVVVTPEKLVYVLRHSPELGSRIGLLVFDEGHQFDAGTRGVTYELLLTSLKALVPSHTQRLLISAVISNGVEIGEWLSGDAPNVVAGTHLLPTERSIAFTSWLDTLGRLEFVAQQNPDQNEFFVPRVIRPFALALRGKETKRRVFPEKGDSQSVALYLGLRLVPNGAVAIFCGRKATATALCERLVDAHDRTLAMKMPLEVSDANEVQLISSLYDSNLKPEAPAARAARLGVFTHHGNTPHGIRLAVEHAMREGAARFVVCTSTLAQGVNLPIRYLIVATTQQGNEKIKVRDFHNLIGRAGRSGMHTEGSVLFANSQIYDQRAREAARWLELKSLLQVANSEPCASTLLSVLLPLQSDGGNAFMSVDPISIAREYVADQQGTGSWITRIATGLARRWFSAESLSTQLARRRDTFAAVESFLLAHWNVEDPEQGASRAAELASQTLAYHLASTQQREQLIQLFELLASNIVTNTSEPEKRTVYGRTLYGLAEATALEKWVADNIEDMKACQSEEDLLLITWDCVSAHIKSDLFARWGPAETLRAFAQGWIRGNSFGALHDAMIAAGVRIGLGARPRVPTMEHMVEMGEGVLGFDGALALGGILEMWRFLRPNDEDRALALLASLEKRVKYGLSSPIAVTIYEMGFADRIVAQELSSVVGEDSSRKAVVRELRENSELAKAILVRFPQYFSWVFRRVVGAA